MCIYIYIVREREREIQIYISLSLYIYIEREYTVYSTQYAVYSMQYTVYSIHICMHTYNPGHALPAAVLLPKIPEISIESLGKSQISRWYLEVLTTIVKFVRSKSRLWNL